MEESAHRNDQASAEVPWDLGLNLYEPAAYSTRVSFALACVIYDPHGRWLDWLMSA